MKIKPGASIKGLDIRMRSALIAAGAVYDSFGKVLVVTSGLDGDHSSGSLHYYGLAVDLRSRYFTKEEKINVVAILKQRLSITYDVIMEIDHIHIEYKLT